MGGAGLTIRSSSQDSKTFGAFYDGEYQSSSGTGTKQTLISSLFDASRSNDIYGKSNTVQPSALTSRFYIKF